MKRWFICAASALITCSLTTAASADDAESGFKGTARLEDGQGVTTSISDDGQAATIIFDSLEVAVGGISKGPQVETQTLTIVMPVTQEGRPHVSQDVRGYFQADPGARCVLLYQAAGKTHVVDLPSVCGRDGDYTFTTTTTLPEGSTSFRATFFLLVDRDNDDPETGAMLTVDTLDLESNQALR